MTTTRSKTLTNLNGSKLEGTKPCGRLLQTGVFSRRSVGNTPLNAKNSPNKSLAGLNPTNPLASFVHQADKNGKQQPILAGGRRISREGSGVNAGQGSFRNLFANFCSALGLNEQQQLDLAKKPQRRSSLTSPKATAPSSAIELRRSVLPQVSPDDASKKCLVLDLDETLVHSSFRPTTNPDYVIPVEIDGTVHQVYVCLRPGAEEFLIEMAQFYEIVVYTASLSKYADPLLDKLDPERVIRYRLFREHCVQYEGSYVKDLSLLDRDLSQTIFIDNSPMSYIFHPRNAIGCSSFIDDPNDSELESISRFLTKYRDVEDVRDHLHIWDATY
ncbi:Nuclear LIM factor interactor-interacting protein cleavage-specific form [Phytophthora megakarya]|uniref:protein-serine/threonine phosphatase n=1 Tax=Phytophthora megakarya TaxID=4795 RepID=A0A225WRM6_9STRA|nr:Nuclear LIM factor interactor-interacting protein cleavage-specific form [Phytophthora megakarya]